MKVAALFSGGKDSSLAVQRVLEKGHEVVRLVSIISRNPDSYMFHTPNIGLTALQAKAAQIPLVTRVSAGVKEKEVDDIGKVMYPLKDEIEGVVVGAIASKYQSDRVAGVCRSLGLSMEAPLWGQDPKQLWLELLAKGFRVMIVGVACDGLGKEWLGRVVDEKALKEMEKLSKRYRFHLGFEGGEAETLCLDAPFFRKRLVVKEASTKWKGDSGLHIISRAVLEDK